MNSPTRFLFLSIFIVFSLNILTAQDRKDYGLLWEIKHKDSNEKSYLFGTIHVKDNRAFKFSDSVIPAIKKAEMFALEINPDSVYNDFDKNYYATGSENVFKRILSKKDYQRLKDRFYEVNQSDLDSFPIMHPQLIASMLSKERVKPDDRRTFLDAYLYGIAYNYKKEVTGLEKIEDQIPSVADLDDSELKERILGVLDSSNEELDEQLEKIIQLYVDGDIDAILDYINNYDPIDKIMVSRNNVMANSLDKIMQNKTVFAAVGTAHLPGKDGILQLLEKKGYTLRKMGATFNQVDEQQTIIPNTDRWHINNNAPLGYSVLTPTIPISLDISGKYETMSSTDLIFGGTFAYMAMDLRNESLKEDFDFVEKIIEGQLKEATDSILSKKTFEKNNIQFTEAIIQKDNVVTRMQLAFDYRIVYVFFSENSLEEITSPYADAFFNSIEVFPPRFEPSVWQTKTDTVGAYSISIPEAEENRIQEKENPNGANGSPYILNIFSSEDKAENTVYVFRYNDQPVGYYLKEKDDYYSYFEGFFKERGTLLHQPKNIRMNGVEGKEYELLFSDKYHTRAKVLLRGNRTYLLMAQKSIANDKIPEDDEFLRSFKFLPYAKATFDTIVKINENYSFKAPSNKVFIEEKLQDASSEYSYAHNYSSIDDNSGGTYLVQNIKLRPYFRKKSLQEFYENYIDAITEYNDTVTSNISTTLAGMFAREITMQNSDTDVKQRMKLLLNDDTITLFLTYLGDEEIKDPRVDEFFDSFEIKKRSNKFDLTASKADLIFKNLKSKDSIKFEEAKGALGYYIFDTSEYKTIAKNLNKTFKDHNDYYGTKYYIISELINLENPKTLKTLTDYYKDKKTSNNARLAILEKILEINDSEAATTYFDLLENHKPERVSGNTYNVLSSMYDTIPLFVANDARFARLANTEDYRDKIAAFYNNNILGDSVYGGKMPLLKNVLLKNMYSDAEIYIDTINQEKYSYVNNSLISSYIDIAKENGNNPEIHRTLQLLVEKLDKDEWLRIQALMTCVELDVEIDAETLNHAFEDMYSRFELMESFVNSNKTDMIPKEYLEQIEFAKLSLYNNAGGEYEEYPNIFNFLGETTVNDKNYYAFSFGYSEDEDEKYIGIAEGAAINFSDFKMVKTYLDWEISEDDWEAQTINIIKNSADFQDSINE